jgi:hypothetical protein
MAEHVALLTARQAPRGELGARAGPEDAFRSLPPARTWQCVRVTDAMEQGIARITPAWPPRTYAKIAVDETRAPVLDPGRGRTKTGYFWAISRDDRPWAGPILPVWSTPMRPDGAASTRPLCWRGIPASSSATGMPSTKQHRRMHAVDAYGGPLRAMAVQHGRLPPTGQACGF